MNETEKLIEEQKKTLPPNLLQAIDIVPWKTYVQEIGKANALDTEQIASLEQETMFIIYAFEPPEDYIANMIREIGISENVAPSIAESIADKIFEPILKKSEEVSVTPPDVLEVTQEIHPMIEKGEVAHGVPHIEESKPKEPSRAPLPDYRYEGGKDPYRRAP